MKYVARIFFPISVIFWTSSVEASIFSGSNCTEIFMQASWTSLIYYPECFDNLPAGFPGVGVINKYYGSSPSMYSYLLFSSDGSGGFSTLVYFFDLPQYTFYCIAGDLNGDNIADLFLAGSSSPWEFNTYYTTENGFSDSYTFIPNQQTRIWGICDMDGDSPPDLYGTSGGTVVAWCGEGFGQYSLTEITGSVSAINVCAADLDSDGDSDIIYATTNCDFHVLLNQGEMVFTEYGTYDPIQASSQLEVCDLNGDDFPDVIAGNYAFTTFINTGSAEFVYGGDFDPGMYLDYYAVHDFDMDDCADLAILCDWNLDIYKGDGAGSFDLQPTLYSSSYAVVSPTSLSIDDYDEDGDPDLCCVITDSGYETMLMCYWNTTYSQGCENGSQNDEGLSFRVSTNPFRNNVTILPSCSGQQIQMEILDLSGRCINTVLQGSDGLFHWDGRGITGEQAPSGVYLVNLISDTGIVSAKLVKLE